MYFCYRYTYIQREMSKYLSGKQYQENKESSWKISKYGRERYKNLSEDKKNKLVEYRKKYYGMIKKHSIIIIYFASFIRKGIRNLFLLPLCLKTNIKCFWFSGHASSFWNIWNFSKGNQCRFENLHMFVFI